MLQFFNGQHDNPTNPITLIEKPMIAVVQRVSESSVSVDEEVIGAIGRGLTVLLGVARGDSAEEARYLAEKIVHLRIFEDEQGKLNRSLLEVGGSLLVVSQFTLLGDCRKGRRPSFIDAAAPENAETLYHVFVDHARAHGISTATGRFRAMMQVSLVNDGPVTLIIQSKPPENLDQKTGSDRIVKET
jgi:D-aminoacyl-tRNA deacylase